MRENFIPKKNWSDFPVIVLTLWIKTFSENINSFKSKYKFGFMDGSYSVLCEQAENIKIYFPFGEITVSKSELKKCLLRACRVVMSSCEKREIKNESVENLREKFYYLKNLE